MPKFKSSLRRQPNVRKEPYKKVNRGSQHQSPSQPSSNLEPQSLDLRLSEIDLANNPVDEVSVGCWLDTKKLKWGRYNDQDTAILHLTIEANHPSNIEVGDFQIDLAFASHQTIPESAPARIPDGTQHCPPTSQERLTAGVTASTTAQNDAPAPSEEQKEIELHGKPAPSTVFRNQQSSWNFSGHRVAAQGGRASIARWIWSSQQPKCSVTHCGSLHCGCIIRHGGPNQPISIMYRIEGRAREDNDSDVSRRYIFKSSPQNSFPWLLTPGRAVHDLTDDEVEKLNDEILLKYGVGQAQQDGRLSQAVAQHRPRGYEARVDGHGTVVQGDMHVYAPPPQENTSGPQSQR